MVSFGFCAKSVTVKLSLPGAPKIFTVWWRNHTPMTKLPALTVPTTAHASVSCVGWSSSLALMSPSGTVPVAVKKLQLYLQYRNHSRIHLHYHTILFGISLQYLLLLKNMWNTKPFKPLQTSALSPLPFLEYQVTWAANFYPSRQKTNSKYDYKCRRCLSSLRKEMRKTLKQPYFDRLPVNISLTHSYYRYVPF